MFNSTKKKEPNMEPRPLRALPNDAPPVAYAQPRHRSAAYAEATQRWDEMEAALNDLQQQNQLQGARIEVQDKTILTLERSLAELKAERDRTIAELKADNNRAISQLKTDNDDLRTKNTQIEERLRMAAEILIHIHSPAISYPVERKAEEAVAAAVAQLSHDESDLPLPSVVTRGPAVVQ